MQITGITLLLLFLSVGYTNCSKPLQGTGSNNQAGDNNGGGGGDGTTPPVVVGKGSRILGIDLLNPDASNDFMKNVALAKEAGIEAMQLNVQWNYLQANRGTACAPGGYTDTMGLSAFNNILKTNNLKMILTVNPVTTNIWVLPSGFSSATFTADPNLVATQNEIDLMACQYSNALDYLFTLFPDIEIVSLQLGNEIDMSPEAAQYNFWANYYRFYAAAAAHARTIRTAKMTNPMKIGLTASMHGLIGDSGTTIKGGLKALNDAVSDVIVVNYYPLNSDMSVQNPAVIPDTFQKLFAIYTDTNKKIHVPEIGYQSGSGYSGSSNEKQAQFVSEVFKTWDTYISRIGFISFLRMNDLSHADALSLAAPYYAPQPAPASFVEYLETLGLRTYSGGDKPAFTQLKSEAKARGW
ncbi:MAG: hypothetical protein K2X47_01210 [Bdellovibrionales bacterium]|nr:hypothetical protein [Bdellovibrionales bacterium]